MTGWTDVLAVDGDVDGEPVPGDVKEFRYAARSFEMVRDDTAHLHEELSRLAGYGSDFEGAAAGAVLQLLKDGASRLKTVPVVAGQLSRTFKHHADRLDALKQQQVSLWARAQTNWTSLNDARSAAEHQESRANVFQRQLEELDEAVADTEYRRVEHERDTARIAAATHRNQETEARNALRTNANQWQDLRRAAQALDEVTADRLRTTKLWELSDPSLKEQGQEALESAGEFIAGLAGGVRDWMAELVDDLIGMAEALLQGDLVEYWYELNEVLDKLLTIATVVAAVAALIGSGGTLAPFMFALAATKLATSSVLYAGQHKLNFESDDDGAVSLTEVAWDVVGVAGARVKMKAFKGTRPPHPASTSKLKEGWDVLSAPAGGSGVHAARSAGLRKWGLYTVQQTDGINSKLRPLETIITNVGEYGGKVETIKKGFEMAEGMRATWQQTGGQVGLPGIEGQLSDLQIPQSDPAGFDGLPLLASSGGGAW